MKKELFDPIKNYNDTKEKISYVDRKNATQEDYNRIGFMSGLEVHQQLLTEKKLFCHCPAGIFHKNDEFDAEIIRHMRPTLSELGEYDGTALMEFRTRKEIVYRINNENACTYEVDDTPPFIINKEALDKALQITMLSKFNLVGEVHITRKQYLDGSIPTGFQRTAILGVEGEIQLKNKKVRLIQLSIEEDSCREISDIGHRRIYKTDRLGMPLIETVTYPDLVNPDEVKEACDYIRFLNRASNNVRTGIGSTREDVNVSCKGGTRVEIKGVAHTKWIPDLTHIECFRQVALLCIRDELKKRFDVENNDFKSEKDVNFFKIDYTELKFDDFDITTEAIKKAKENHHKLYAVNLPKFQGILSHFTQPGKCFADEISDRLKVIACIEKPNMIHTELPDHSITDIDMQIIKLSLKTDEDNDAIIVFWAADDDVKTALETIEERCKLAFCGVPNETRKSFENGTTIFERVLPGADRMYPDTDSTPIPLNETHVENLKQTIFAYDIHRGDLLSVDKQSEPIVLTEEYLNDLRKNLPEDISDRIIQLQKWNFPEDTNVYILRRNLYPFIKKAVELGYDNMFLAKLFGHNLKHLEGKFKKNINPEKIYNLLVYLKKEEIEQGIASKLLSKIFENPNADFDEILAMANFKKYSEKEIIEKINKLSLEFDKVAKTNNKGNKVSWIMEELCNFALGNMSLSKLQQEITNRI